VRHRLVRTKGRQGGVWFSEGPDIPAVIKQANEAVLPWLVITTKVIRKQSYRSYSWHSNEVKACLKLDQSHCRLPFTVSVLLYQKEWYKWHYRLLKPASLSWVTVSLGDSLSKQQRLKQHGHDLWDRWELIHERRAGGVVCRVHIWPWTRLPMIPSLWGTLYFFLHRIWTTMVNKGAPPKSTNSMGAC